MQAVDERHKLLRLLELLSERTWDDLTTIKAMFATEKWDLLIETLENNQVLTEKQFLDIIKEE